MNPVLQKIELTFEEATQVANKLGQFSGGLVYEELHLIVSKLKSSALESLNNSAPSAVAAAATPLVDSTAAAFEQIADNAVVSIGLDTAPAPVAAMPINAPIPAVETVEEMPTAADILHPTLEAAAAAPVAVDPEPVAVAPAMNIPG